MTDPRGLASRCLRLCSATGLGALDGCHTITGREDAFSNMRRQAGRRRAGGRHLGRRYGSENN